MRDTIQRFLYLIIHFKISGDFFFTFLIIIIIILFNTAKKLEMNRDGKIVSSVSPSLVTSGVLKLHHQQQSSPLQRHDTVSCWMDIVAGTDPTGRPVETFLRVGQDATIVIRVRQQGKNTKKKLQSTACNRCNWIVSYLHRSMKDILAICFQVGTGNRIPFTITCKSAHAASSYFFLSSYLSFLF